MISASAPGRVNVIGDHTDYNQGLVLPAPVPQRAHVEIERRDDDVVVVTSRERGEASFDVRSDRRAGDWTDYVRGCFAVLRDAGHHVTGVSLRIRSDVPLGSGLSSSAALEVAVLRGLRRAFELAISDLDLALWAQRVENDFVGVPVGVMDPMVASLGKPGEALFIDTRSLEHQSIALSGADLLVVSSGVHHSHATNAYRARVDECARAARRLGVRSLRDVEDDILGSAIQLPPPLDRRVRHVVSENARVRVVADALRTRSFDVAGELMRDSHLSMRDDFEVSVPEIDLLVDIANDMPDVYGARLTGGGFGGSIVGLTRQGAARSLAPAIVEQYGRRAGLRADVLVAGEVSCGPS